MVKVINGATSPETAYVVKDYPFGFRLRCMQRHWIETRKGHGQRLVNQTTHKAFNGDYTPSEDAAPPPAHLWNKPKAGVYSPMVILYIDEADGYVKHDELSFYTSVAEVDAFHAKYGSQFDADQQAHFDLIRRIVVRKTAA